MGGEGEREEIKMRMNTRVTRLGRSRDLILEYHKNFDKR